MTRQPFGRVSTRMLDRLGQSVTLRNRAAATDAGGDTERDDHGTVVWDDWTETTAQADLVMRGTPTFERRADGLEADVDAVAILADDAPVTDGEDDAATAATRIDAGGRTYVVRSTWDEPSGLTRAHCVEEE